MKVLLTTLNAKFVHTTLALRYLYHFCRADYPELFWREFNINQNLSWVCGEIYQEHSEVIAFSCNIWNIDLILILAKRLKTLNPNLVIILGGPEVSADPEAILRENPAVDFVVVGEGELTFKEYLSEFAKEKPLWSLVKGLVYREGTHIIKNISRPLIDDLAIIPCPYPDDLTPLRHNLVYYETSRGCPFNCQYCLSANDGGVRFFSWDRVTQDLLRFINAGIVRVKFLDRSFNCNPNWAKQIWRFLMSHPGKTNFHFEIVGELIDEESIELLSLAPPGLFQFEIGVQTTNSHALELVKRKMDFTQLKNQVGKLLTKRNVFVHLDLIAGLPAEDYQSFGMTFNDNMAIRPDQLQLGFLKLLKGSGLRERAAEFGYIYTMETPYEVLANHWISYPELLRLKVIEDLLERYYNSGRFASSLEFLFRQFSSPFQMFEELADWWKAQGFDEYSHKDKNLYRYLLEFYQTFFDNNDQILRNFLKYDLLSWEHLVELPEWAGKISSDLKELSYRFWLDNRNIDHLIPEFRELTIREIQRRVLLAEFDFNPLSLNFQTLSRESHLLLFIYTEKKAKVVRIK